MTPQEASPRRPSLQSRYLSVRSQPQTVPVDNVDSRDTFNYQDYGPSETPSRKREKAHTAPSSQDSRLSADLEGSLDHEELVKRLESRLESNIYEKETKGTRARFPDEDHVSNAHNTVFNKPTSSNGLSATTHQNARRSRFRRANLPLNQPPLRSSDQTKLRCVMLNWSKREVNGEQRFLLEAKVLPANEHSLAPNTVIWQHSEYDDIKLTEFETLAAQLRYCGLQDSAIGLTKRLLKRVKLVAERSFVRGSFLTPKAFRYDMLDDSRYGKDKCCIFLNFPYFAVDRPWKKAGFVKGDPRHPVRTILQSRYRLNETTERDESQCVRMLDGNALRSCIKAAPEETSRLNSKKNDELIYVPQLWALIAGLDHMVTAGPVNDRALQGDVILFKDDVEHERPGSYRFVQISFISGGMLQDITYPMAQCASWFGLLNKHQKIRNALKGQNSKDYPLQIGHHLLNGEVWASIQRSADEETLKIWMETPKTPEVKFPVNDDNGGRASGTDDTLLAHSRSSSFQLANFSRLNPVPIVKALLAWRVVDDFGEIDESPTGVQIKRFLNAIYASLPGRLVTGPVSGTTTDHRNTRAARSARPIVNIQGKTSADIDQLGYDRSCESGEKSTEQELWWATKRLFDCFIPSEHERGSAPIQLFWGSLYEIMEVRGRHVQDLLMKIQEITGWADQLHLGVHIERIGRSAGGLDEYQHDISENAVLLASVVDGLGAIFNMLIEVVRFIRQGNNRNKPEQLSLGSQATDYSDEACRSLEIARDQLITEATGQALGENVGPVVTPEAILIMTMNRLVRGVFATGNVDVINILEECLEQLALRVETHSSRRLLEKLNAFEEEVAIVNDVLQQQINVLLTFRDCLNPEEFKKPTIARKMRFDFESRGIEEIVNYIKEQLRHCKELRERAGVLAVQNVQLVETRADDNGRAIFVFTFITVLFLPLSFVAGFFGMNLAGIANSERGVSHFWYIAIPLTVGIWVLCAVIMTRGEQIWFAVSDLPKFFRTLMGRDKRRRA